MIAFIQKNDPPTRQAIEAVVHQCPNCQITVSSQWESCPSCGTNLRKPEDPFIGKLIAEKYLVLRKIGAGGFGSVYEARHARLDSKVAIKTLHSESLRQRLVVERFRREALATSRLQSPHTVKILDRGGTNDGTLWLAMEFVEGISLEEFLQQKKKLTEEELLCLLLPICEALAEAHQKGIVHRDVKPQNIMLMNTSGKLFPKILDFGIAGLHEADSQVTSTGMVSGTPKYMAPEQWEGLKNTDARTDIYALGMIAYQCLAGELPFVADNPLAWMKLHTFATPKPLEGVSAHTQNAIMSAIQKDRGARPKNIEEFRAMLQGKSSLPIQTHPTPVALSTPLDKTLPHITEPTKRYSWMWFVSAVLGLFCVGLAVQWLQKEKPTQIVSSPLSQFSAPKISGGMPQSSTSEPEQVTAKPPARSESASACLQATSLEDTFQKCQIAAKEKMLEPQVIQKIEENKKLVIETYGRMIKGIISSGATKNPNLNQAEAALVLLESLQDDPDIVALQKQWKGFTDKVNLWEKIQREKVAMAKCSLLGQFLKKKLSPTERLDAIALRDSQFSDGMTFEICQ